MQQATVYRAGVRHLEELLENIPCLVGRWQCCRLQDHRCVLYVLYAELRRSSTKLPPREAVVGGHHQRASQLRYLLVRRHIL